jgi:3',5'-cyclic AMP phosphodiesterase CpdA
MPALNRRQFLATGLAAAGMGAAGATLGSHVLPLLAREDLVPGQAPDLRLEPRAWTSAEDRLTFAAMGDNGSGGRQAMAVASRLANTYTARPFELVALLGDICYYGNIARRFDAVFLRPMKPLIDAGVRFELAIGNHDVALHHSDAGLEEIEAELRLLGTPGLYYTTTHGPVAFFYLDSSVPALFGPSASEQRDWLDDALHRSSKQWKIVALHHPPYSSGRHGSTVGARQMLEPILVRHHVDLVLAGHDHHYERTHPQQGVTYVVSGGGCKTSRVGHSSFTAFAQSTLEFLLFDVEGDRLRGTCIRPDGHIVDRFELRAREGR